MKSGKEKGILFEKWIFRKLIEGVDLSLFPLGDPEKVQEVKIPSLKLIDFHYYSEALLNKNKVKPNQTGVPCAYVPCTENFPYWDIVIHEPPETTSGRGNQHRLTFVQCSVSKFREHDSKSQPHKDEVKESNAKIQSEEGKLEKSLKGMNDESFLFSSLL